ncbi:MAG: methyltransferase domain-containing protein [Gemmatimonadetes bacterium]|nr:methyltransferase domain-containing protein [Gemmatimonadota bacterium]NIO33292.1 methyltransferase domain-containing protein [Gemmatimonadota bacterium]
MLADLAGSGPVLELGIGTGRLALPLSERGVEVHGIDASEAMVAKLRAKPGGDRIPVRMGDFADLEVEGQFSLIAVAFSTFFSLRSQEEQVRCFRNVALHLSDDGLFVIEAFVPDVSRFDRQQRVGASKVKSDGEVMLEVSQHDPTQQRVDAQHIVLSEAGIEMYPVKVRYSYPAELDLMAQLAGLRLRERWGGWRREPFTASSIWHVSVYERFRS